MYYKSIDIAKASDTIAKARYTNGWEYLIVILYVLFYESVDDGIGVGMLYYVRPVLQIVTNPLLITYCTLSTTYTTNNYNVNISNESYRIIEIPWNKYK